MTQTLTLSQNLIQPAPAATGPLSMQQQQELCAAQARAKAIRRACGVAKFDAWATAIFAGVTLLSAVFSPSSLIIGVPFAAIAYNAFAGEKLLRQFDLRGPRRLGINQLFLLGLILAYCIWQLVTYLTGNVVSEYAQLGEAGAALGMDMDRLTRIIALALYGSVAIASLLTQGGMAIYYFSRARLVREYLSDTPDWVLQLQRTLV